MARDLNLKCVDKPSIVLPPVIPDHELIRCIGQGSYGDVWLARTQIGRFRAVKVVYGHRFRDNERPFERELDGLKKYEPISLAPGLMPILHFGRNEAEGYFYYVMELADDRESGAQINPATYVPRTLAADLTTRKRLPVRECVTLGIALAEALHELHRRDLVHRDIKPSNVIFVNGAPKLADIGLIAPLADARSYVGTEGFIAPEGPNSRQGDVYSLGKLLYEVSTGNDRTEFPTLPPELAAQKEFVELNEVLVKACDANLQRRYQTVKEAEADLALLQGGNSVRRLRRLERLVGQLKKLAVAAFLVLPVALLTYLQVDYREKKAAEIRQLQLGGHLAEGTYALQRGDYAGALSPFLSAAMLDTSDAGSARTHRLRLKQVLDRCPKLVQVFFHDRTQVDHAEFSPSEDLVLTATYWGRAQLWNSETGQSLPFSFASSNTLESATFSPDGNYVLTADKHGWVEVWDIHTSQSIFKVLHPEKGLNSARFSPDGNEIVTAGGRGVARLWKFPSGEMKAVFTNHTQELIYAGYSSDGRYLLTTGRDSRATVRNAQTHAILHSFMPGTWVHHGDFSPDGRFLVIARFDRCAQVLNLGTGEPVHPLMPHGDGVSSARFSANGRYIVTACLDGIVRIWDATNRQLLAENPLLHHGDRVFDASFSRDGRRVLTACNDGTVRIWDLAGGVAMSEMLPYPPPPQTPENTRISEDGRYRVVYNRKTAQVYDHRSGKPMYEPLQPGLNIAGATFSPDGRFLSLFGSSRATLWNVKNGRSAFPIPAYENKVRFTAFSRDSRKLVVCTTSDGFEKCFAEIWSLERRSPVGRRLQHGDGVLMAGFSPDGRRLVTASEDFYATLWDAETGEQLAPSLLHEHKVCYAAFSESGEWLVTASVDRNVRLWDAATRRPITPPMLIPAGNPASAQFVHNDTAVLIMSAEGNAWLWKLNGESRSFADLASLYELVCGRADLESSRFRVTPQEGLMRSWARFTREHSADFQISPAEIAAWVLNR